MNSMEIVIDELSLEIVFKIIEAIHLGKVNKISLNELKSMFSQVEIIVPETDSNGLFAVDLTTFDTGKLSNEIKEIISATSTELSVQQFLISMLVEPDRLWIRWFGKVCSKVEKIRKFSNPPWLINTDVVNKIIDDFISRMKDMLFKL